MRVLDICIDEPRGRFYVLGTCHTESGIRSYGIGTWTLDTHDYEGMVLVPQLEVSRERLGLERVSERELLLCSDRFACSVTLPKEDELAQAPDREVTIPNGSFRALPAVDPVMPCSYLRAMERGPHGALLYRQHRH